MSSIRYRGVGPCPVAAGARSTDGARAALRGQLEALDWYHTQEVAPDLVTPGMFDLRPYVDRYGIEADLRGRRALDVGTFEGFWAFELERRGAEVVAIDLDSVDELDWPPRLRPVDPGRRGEGFELVRAALGSSVERVGVSVYDAVPEILGGTFDLVLCGSVLIHLRDPMLALERLVDLCRGRLVLAEEYSRRLAWLPFCAAEFRGEHPWSTWWRPSPRTWVAMTRCAGFERAREHKRFRMRLREGRSSISHVVVHAEGPAT